MNCKNANILAQESINMNAEESISSISGEDTTIQAGRSLTETASESYTLSELLIFTFFGEDKSISSTVLSKLTFSAVSEIVDACTL